MNRFKRGILGKSQRLGRSLMPAVAILPVAALLLRVGQSDLWKPFGILPDGIPWMVASGTAILGNLALVFAISISIGLSDENEGVAALAATIGYFILTKVATTINEDINMGIFAGVIVGILAAFLYNKYKAMKTPIILGFFGGKRFVPIITAVYTLLIGLIVGYIWPLVQSGVYTVGNILEVYGTIGIFIFGFLNRLLIPFGLDHVVNSLYLFEYDDFMTGFYPIMMIALPAACLAMIRAAKKENKKAVSGIFLSAAFTSLVTGTTAPIEFIFMFLSPVLYVIHAILTGCSLALASYLGMEASFNYSAGLIDYLLNFTLATKPIELLLLGVVFGVIYYFVFLVFIKKFDIPTPGRGREKESSILINLEKDELDEKSKQIIEALGGKENLVEIEACITKIRVEVVDGDKVEKVALKEIGATGVIELNEINFMIVVGTVAELLVTQIKQQTNC